MSQISDSKSSLLTSLDLHALYPATTSTSRDRQPGSSSSGFDRFASSKQNSLGPITIEQIQFFGDGREMIIQDNRGNTHAFHQREESAGQRRGQSFQLDWSIPEIASALGIPIPHLTSQAGRVWAEYFGRYREDILHKRRIGFETANFIARWGNKQLLPHYIEMKFVKYDGKTDLCDYCQNPIQPVSIRIQNHLIKKATVITSLDVHSLAQHGENEPRHASGRPGHIDVKLLEEVLSLNSPSP